jgi:hypothetical protein
MNWIDVNDRLPELDMSEDADYESSRRLVLTANSFGQVNPLTYTYNRHAKAERHRQPRWEMSNGSVYHGTITHWMPLPPHPSKSPVFSPGFVERADDETTWIAAKGPAGTQSGIAFTLDTRLAQDVGLDEDARCEYAAAKIADDTLQITIRKLPDLPLTDEDVKAIDEKIHKVLPREDPGVRY